MFLNKTREKEKMVKKNCNFVIFLLQNHYNFD